MRRLSGLKEEVESWRSLDDKASSLHELLTLSIEEKDDSLLDAFSQELGEIQERLAELEFKLVLSGPYDERNAIMALHAGAGGVESQDWASMLMRMYMRWAERRGYKGELLDVSVGDEAGQSLRRLRFDRASKTSRLPCRKAVPLRLCCGSRTRRYFVSAPKVSKSRTSSTLV